MYFLYTLIVFFCFNLLATANEGHPPTEDHTAPGEVHAQSDSLETAVDQFWDQEVENLLHRAYIAIKLEKYDLAENFYTQVLNRKLEDSKRKTILLEMADMYRKLKIYSKTCAVYEKFLELYPKDPDIHNIYLKLGNLYQEMGAPEKAIERYYSILNFSLGAKAEQIQSMQAATLEAQIQIARTYLSMGKYEEARNFFSRIQKLPLEDGQLEDISFQIAFCSYHIKDYPQTLKLLQDFVSKYPDSQNVPEAHFLLANTYKELNQVDNTLSEVKKLIAATASSKNTALWIFWQKKTANQIANTFYKSADYMNALKVYQAMLPLDKSPSWQWPIIYQIGLCFENLSMYPKAQEAYSVLINPKDWELKEGSIDDYLKSIQDMAKWRKEHLEWFTNTDLQIKQILNQTHV